MPYRAKHTTNATVRVKVVLALVLISAFLCPSVTFSGGVHGSGYQSPSDKPQINKVRDQNCANLEKLSLGITKNETLEIMGNSKIECLAGKEPVTVSQPFKSETKGWENQEYEILYYYTHVKQKDRQITDDELTPIIFNSGKLIGWGWNFYEETFPSTKSPD